MSDTPAPAPASAPASASERQNIEWVIADMTYTDLYNKYGPEADVQQHFESTKWEIMNKTYTELYNKYGADVDVQNTTTSS